MALELQSELAEADSTVSLFISAICAQNIVAKKKKKEGTRSHRQHLLVIVTASAQTTSIVYGLQKQSSAGNDRC